MTLTRGREPSANRPRDPMFEMSGMSQAVIALAQIMLINVVLSGDNAVVIALACRRLSPAHQKQAFIWGSVGVVVLMIGLTACVVFLLSLPYLEIVGSLMPMPSMKPRRV